MLICFQFYGDFLDCFLGRRTGWGDSPVGGKGRLGMIGRLRGKKAFDQGYVLETGRISLSGTGRELLADESVKAAYLGKKKK